VTKIGTHIAKWASDVKNPHPYPVQIRLAEKAALVQIFSDKSKRVRKYLPLDKPIAFQYKGAIVSIMIEVAEAKLKLAKQHAIFCVKNKESVLWELIPTTKSYIQVEESDVLEDREENIEIDQNLELADRQGRIISENIEQRLDKAEKIAKKALYYKNLSRRFRQQFKEVSSENKRLREEFNDSIEREKKLKVESDQLLEEYDGLKKISKKKDLMINVVNAHMALYESHFSSGGLTSPLNQTPFKLEEQSLPLKCDNLNCRAYLSKGTYKSMKEHGTGVFCLNCKSEHQDKSKSAGFFPDWKTAIVANQKFTLDLIEKNSEGLVKLEEMKDAGFLNNITKLEMPKEENERLWYPENKVFIPKPIYQSEAQPQREELRLPAFQVYLDYAMTTEQLNALLGINFPSYLEFLRKQENSIRGASIWSNQYFPSSLKTRTQQFSEAEDRSYAQARQREIQELTVDSNISSEFNNQQRQNEI